MFTDGQKCVNTLISLRVVRKLFRVELKANILTKFCAKMAAVHTFGNLLGFSGMGQKETNFNLEIKKIA